jgi:hypothetical protein
MGAVVSVPFLENLLKNRVDERQKNSNGQAQTVGRSSRALRVDDVRQRDVNSRHGKRHNEQKKKARTCVFPGSPIYTQVQLTSPNIRCKIENRKSKLKNPSPSAVIFSLRLTFYVLRPTHHLLTPRGIQRHNLWDAFVWKNQHRGDFGGRPGGKHFSDITGPHW